jgi:glycine/D-amino acid oxidase-like deaminating enzyme
VRAIVVGAGINGVTAAIALRKRGHDVDLIDPGPLPHPLAASTDISKAVRAAYGADEIYTELAEHCVPIWREWNAQFGVTLFHEVGFLFMRRTPMREGDFEFETAKVFARRGHKFARFEEMKRRFPIWATGNFGDGIFEPEAGYAVAERVVSVLLAHAAELGVKVRGGNAFADLIGNGRVTGVVLQDRQRIVADEVVMCAGAWTPQLLPFTKDFLRATAHPVFHLRPKQPDLFRSDVFPVFGADISATGYYGFPLNADGVVKIGVHGSGREMSADSEQRVVDANEENQLREFLNEAFPQLTDAPIVFSRICMYCDTNDGDFWIARDPERPGLTIATGDNGHGFKFAPVWGELTADAVEEKPNPLLEKFRWRPEVPAGIKKEAARFAGYS